MTEAKPSAWQALQERAGAQVALLGTEGLPTRRVEAWHYTSLHSLNNTAWAEALPLNHSDIEAWVKALNLPDHAHFVVFANGVEQEDLTSLSETLIREEDTGLGSLSGRLENHFSARLNSALTQGGMSIRVPSGVDAGVLILLNLTEGDGVSTHLRHRVTLEDGAHLTLLDLHFGRGRYLANPCVDVVCGQKAHLRHVKHQCESAEATHLGIVEAHISGRGDYDSFTLNQGGALARHEVVSVLEAPHANTNVNAIQLVNGTRLNDLTSLIHHAAPDCTSRQTVRTVLSDTAQGVFQGKILVDQVAQKTDGYQMNQALLLSEKAQINSKPELEIYADDVKCSHGATVGALDEEQLFYLRSRGVPEVQARDMLVQAFLRETLELLGDEAVQNYLLGSLSGHV